jgi:hypothetical protein
MIVKNIFVLLFLSGILVGCATTYSDNMMADGNTWNISVSDIPSCNGYMSSDSCVNALMPKIKQRGEQICSKPPYRIFACGKTTQSGLVAVACNIQCKEVAQIQLKGSEPQQSEEIVDKNILAKAKKCQERGGVWVNNSCQISLD